MTGSPSGREFQMNRTVERTSRSGSALRWIAGAVFLGILVLLGLLYWRGNIPGKSVLILGLMLFGTYSAALFHFIYAKREDRIREKLFPKGSFSSPLLRKTRERIGGLRNAKKFADADGLIRRIFLGFAVLAGSGALLTAILGYFVAAAILGTVGLFIALLFGTGRGEAGKADGVGATVDKD